jgi:pSer/pThr/pTyr-binding forkhead associated (FHA) protein
VEGSQTGRRFPLRSDEIVIGSSRSADIVLPDSKVAARHVRLVFKNAHYQVEDLSQGPGLKVNGRPMPRGKLTFGDRLTLGDTTLLLLPE